MLPPNLSRRGQGISINVVIIAAIALVVLIVMILLVSRGGRNIGEAAGERSCLAQGGTCRPGLAAESCPQGEAAVDPAAPQLNCNVGQICCRYNFGG